MAAAKKNRLKQLNTAVVAARKTENPKKRALEGKQATGRLQRSYHLRMLQARRLEPALPSDRKKIRQLRLLGSDATLRVQYRQDYLLAAHPPGKGESSTS